MNLLNYPKPSIASLKVRVVHFGENGRPSYEDVVSSVVKLQSVKRSNGIIKDKIVPIPIMGLMLRTIIEPES